MGEFLTAKKEKAICKICKREFITYDKIPGMFCVRGKDYCSPDCLNKDIKKEEKQNNKICVICKNEFYSRHKIVKTCSKSCASKYRSITVKRGLKKKYKKLCCICKKPFKTNLKKVRCCGTKCGSKLASRNRINNYKKYGT